ncbi:hypothetical protein [Streptomyces sp. NPDC018347]|uniref:hypothetical protein n=1 Tax=Streptomyces sp. NPDC018347 TaxID=3157193 RepID=UPI0033F1B869
MRPLNRPDHISDTDRADYQQRPAEHDTLMAQTAEREARLEHDLIAAYDEYEADFSRRTPPPHPTPAARRRSRGR